jgi:hypothetical protein
MFNLSFPAPLLVFFGLVAIALILKLILPAGTTLHLSKYMVAGLIGSGVMVALLVAITILVLVYKN